MSVYMNMRARTYLTTYPYKETSLDKHKQFEPTWPRPTEYTRS